MNQPTQTRPHPFEVEQVTPDDRPNLPAPQSEEIDLLASISNLGIDLRVWA